MATTSRIAQTKRTIGEVTPTVTLTLVGERMSLDFTSTQVGSVTSQARLVVLDKNGLVQKTATISGSDTQRVIIDSGDLHEAGDLSAYIECLQGTCQVTLQELSGSEGILPGTAGGQIEADDIPDGSIITAKVAAGAATLPKLDFSGLKVLTAVGLASAGAITLTGTAVGDRLIAAWGVATAAASNNTPIVELPGTDFEAVVTVADQLQQLSGAGDISLNSYVFLLIPAAA